MNKAYEFYRQLGGLYWLIKTQLFYRQLLGAVGSRSRIIKPLNLRNARHIYIGSRVTIQKHSWLLTLQLNKNQTPKLVIGDGAAIGYFNHITCVNHVEIGPKVLTADGVHISDNGHTFDNSRIPIMDQPVISKGSVFIGEGTWIGENVSVLSCRIGRNCTIGANAVVTHDIPDFCVAVGIPARVIKQFDPESGTWRHT
jgi:acetyltransferase-like isoleucine patch superfamily enzyme